jgi:hypothetical protein
MMFTIGDADIADYLSLWHASTGRLANSEISRYGGSGISMLVRLSMPGALLKSLVAKTPFEVIPRPPKERTLNQPFSIEARGAVKAVRFRALLVQLAPLRGPGGPL